MISHSTITVPPLPEIYSKTIRKHAKHQNILDQQKQWQKLWILSNVILFNYHHRPNPVQTRSHGGCRSPRFWLYTRTLTTTIVLWYNDRLIPSSHHSRSHDKWTTVIRVVFKCCSEKWSEPFYIITSFNITWQMDNCQEGCVEVL
jgi:hypothetical protein